MTEHIWLDMGVLEAVDDTTSLFHIGGNSPDDLAWIVATLRVDFSVTEPPELREALRAMSERIDNSIAAPD